MVLVWRIANNSPNFPAIQYMQVSMFVQSLFNVFLSLDYNEVQVDDFVHFDQPCNLPGG